MTTQSADVVADSEQTLRVSLVGTGTMGSGMAINLLAAGYPLALTSRTRARAEPLVAAGASWRDTIADCVADADFAITAVGMPDEVREVYFGDSGVLASARAGAVLIDMGTTPPTLAREIDTAARERGLAALDAPVSGGQQGARDATLSIMVGGEPAVFERARPILAAMGKTIVHQGPSGAGQSAKLCNQIAIASNVVGVCEALVFARRSGLDPVTVLASIGAGAAASWSLANLYPRMARGDYEPGFLVHHFVKDIRIALDEADRMGLVLPGLDLASRLYDLVVALGGDRLGTQALYLALDDLQRQPARTRHYFDPLRPGGSP